MVGKDRCYFFISSFLPEGFPFPLGACVGLHHLIVAHAVPSISLFNFALSPVAHILSFYTPLLSPVTPLALSSQLRSLRCIVRITRVIRMSRSMRE